MNSGAVIWIGASGPNVYNNYFRGNMFQTFIQKFLNVLSSVGGFTYSVDDASLNAAIAEITANLPAAD